MTEFLVEVAKAIGLLGLFAVMAWGVKMLD
jgi:hypothetical protein